MGRQDTDREAARAEARERRRAYYESLSPEEQKAYRERVRRARKIKKLRKMAIQGAAILLLIIVAMIGVLNQKGCGKDKADKDKETQQEVDKTPGEGAAAGTLEAPDWVIENFVRKHEDSRPGTAMAQVDGIVIHDTGAPGKSAEAIRSEFDLLDKTEEGSPAVHFVIGIDGTVIQCIPLSEISPAAGGQGTSYISIECCHIDDSGKFSKATYETLVRLTEWLLDSYDLEPANVKRHYDVTGDACPSYYVDNGAAWNQFMVDLGGEPVVPEETLVPEETTESTDETPEETSGSASEA
jgi:hypothetical protein